MLSLLLLSSPVVGAVAGEPCPTVLQAKASVIVGDLNGNKTDTDQTITDTIVGVTESSSTDSIVP